MDFIVNQVVQLEEIYVTDGYGVIELVARAPVIEDALAVLAEICKLQALGEFVTSFWVCSASSEMCVNHLFAIVSSFPK